MLETFWPPFQNNFVGIFSCENRVLELFTDESVAYRWYLVLYDCRVFCH